MRWSGSNIPKRGIKTSPYMLKNGGSGVYPIVCAFSLRKIKGGKINPIIVRESSADATLTIGFRGKSLDTRTLLAFCGSNSGYITTFNDPSGNNNNALQTTNNNQPRIVNAGTLDVDSNGKPTIVFDNVNDCFKITDNSNLQLTQKLSINFIAKVDLAGDAGYIFCRNGATAGEIQYASHWNVTTDWNFYLEGSVRDANTDAAENTRYIVTQTWTGTSADVFSNGVSDGASAYNATLTNRTNTFIGARSNAADGSTQAILFGGNISELILFNISLNTSQRQKLERNQSKYYNISVA